MAQNWGDRAVFYLLPFIKIWYLPFFAMIHSHSFTCFGLVISIFFLRLLSFGTFRLLSSLRAGVNRHQIPTRMELLKCTSDILSKVSCSRLSPAQPSSPKQERAGCEPSNASALVGAWQNCQLREGSLGHSDAWRLPVLQTEGYVKPDALSGAEILNGSLATGYLEK